VRFWQAWNEPNLTTYLAPQWTQTRTGFVPISPDIYRAMLNAFYRAVKRVSRSNFVVAAGNSPYGDPGSGRMPPLAFDRALFCLRGARLTPVRCPDPPHLDAFDHHPYDYGAPTDRALNPDDVSVPDIWKIERVLRAAERTGRALPGGAKAMWVTEISWDSSPPDPQGVPIATQARWLEYAFYLLWEQGVDTVMWLQVVDSPPVPSYAASYQAGVFYLSGLPKPSATAFRFPFITRRLSSSSVLAWGRAPATGTLRIERLQGRRWVPLRRLAVRALEVFQTTLHLVGRGVYRAQVAGLASLAFSDSVVSTWR
jgi:hypothetical protein